MRYTYDLHIHSALSPCAEEEMTPNNIVNMAYIKGLDIIAVTDHNSAANIRAVSECAEKTDVLLVPGIEVESAEEVHICCLFEDVDSAEEMGEQIKRHLPDMKNSEKIFGSQVLMDSMDNITGKEEQMLIVSADLTSEQIFSMTEELGGLAYYAHVDRDSYSVISVLGGFPDSVQTDVVEVSNSEKGHMFMKTREELIKGKTLLFSSDAHRLKDMNDGEEYLEITAEGKSVTAADVLKALKGKIRR